MYTENRTLNAGNQTFAWDGKLSSGGGVAPSGDYTISVTAADLSGAPVNVSTELVGIVDLVDLSGATPMLAIGSVLVEIDKVKSMRKTGV